MALLRSSMYGQNWWDNYEYPMSLLDQHFGTGLFDSDMHPPMMYRGYLLRPRTNETMDSSGKSEIKNETEKFEVTLDVKHFKPDEIEVKVVDNYVVIHGKHAEKTDEHGSIEREFTRRYMLPEGAEFEKVTSSLDANGVLTIEAPKKPIEAHQPNERVVPINLSSSASEEEKPAEAD